MNNSAKAIDNWLVSVEEDDLSMEESWASGFEVGRQVIYSKLGPYHKLFLRPDKFSPRFYHTIYPLTVEEWQCVEQVLLYDGFCTMGIQLDVRFQATFKYASSNMEILSELNESIKNAYYGLTFDIVHRALLNLSDGAWVQEGLEQVEKKVSFDVSEMLILQNIQSQVICKLKPSFEEFPDVQFAKESVYLSVLKKNFEFNELQKEVLFLHQQKEQKQSTTHKRIQLEHIDQYAELEREKQALKAENTKILLQEKALQQLEQYELKRQMYEEKIQHENNLHQISLEAELRQKEEQKNKFRELEAQDQVVFIEHQARLKHKELDAKVAEYEREQVRWREAKDKTHSDALDLKHRQKQLEFDTDTGYKKRYEQQRIALQEESYMTRKKSDVYLKREIELLELERQRLDLQMTIKGYKDKENKINNEDE